VTGTGYTVTDAGSLKQNAMTVDHLVISQPGVASQNQTDIYLDARTYLPATIVFQVNPYKEQKSNQPSSQQSGGVPEAIRFSDYRSLQGWMLPFHIQAYLGKTPLYIMDLTISSAVFDSGATISTAVSAAN